MDLELLGLIMQVKNKTYSKDEINHIIETINQFKIIKVEMLPSEDIDEQAIYLLRKIGTTNDIFDEFIYVDNSWEKIGTTEIDLSNYTTFSDVSAMLTDYSTISEVNSAISTALSDYSTTNDVETAIVTALTEYATTSNVNTAINVALSDYSTTSDINTAISSATSNVVRSTSVTSIWKGTQAEYDILPSVDDNTFYLIIAASTTTTSEGE